MTNKSGNIGTATATGIIKYLKANGWPHAELRNLAGALDKGDIVGTPGICWESKGGKAAEKASDGQVEKWLAETEAERVNSGADIGVLVMKRAGIGMPRAGEFWAVMPMGTLLYITGDGGKGDVGCYQPVRMHLSAVVELIRFAGYGS